MNTLKQYTKIIRRFINNHAVLAVVVGLFVLLDIALVFNTFQNKFPILGLRFEGQPISFQTQDNLTHIVAKSAAANTKALLFTYNGKIYTLSSADVGYTVNPSYSANRLLGIGRTGNIITRLLTQTASLLGLEDIPLSGNIAKATLTLKMLSLQEEINQKPIPIHPDFTGNINKTLPAQDGIALDSKRLAAAITTHITNPPAHPLPLPVLSVPATYHAESELTPIRKQAQILGKQPISISSAGQIFTLSPTDIQAMMVVVERPDPQNPKKNKLILRLDDTKLAQKLDNFAFIVETATHAEFDYEDALATIYGQFYFNRHKLTVVPAANLSASPKVLGAQTVVTAPKVAYLTFDDGPNTIYHPLILDILKQYNVKATFFLIGNNIPLAKDAAIRTYTEGHLVGNHTLTHSFLPNFSSSFISNEITTTNTLLKSINGNKDVTFFRPPFGGINQTVIQVAHQNGLKVFLWDVDPRDWAEPPTDVLVSRVVDYVHNGSNVLLHSNHLATVKALPIILQTLISEGYTFKTLDSFPTPEEL